MTPWMRQARIIAFIAPVVFGCGSSDDNTPWTALNAGGNGGAGGTPNVDGGIGAPDAHGPDVLIAIDATDEPAACTSLNIAILGVAGPNPSSDFQAWLVARGTSVTRFQTNASEALTSADLNKYDVAIIDELVRDYTSADASTMQSWISAGHGLVSMTGHTGSSISFRPNVLLASLGVAYGGGLLDGPVTEFVQHPVTTGLTSVSFYGGYHITEVSAASTRTVFATLDSGPVGYAVQLDDGRAVVWGDEWIEYDSEWAALPQIQQFWVNIFDWIKPTGKCGLVVPK